MISGGRDELLGRADRGPGLGHPRCQWIEYPDTGHLVLEEQPAELAADVLAFLDDPPARGPGTS